MGGAEEAACAVRIEEAGRRMGGVSEVADVGPPHPYRIEAVT